MTDKFIYAYFFILNKKQGFRTKVTCDYYYGEYESQTIISKDDFCKVITDRVRKHPMSIHLDIKKIKESIGYDSIAHSAFEECTIGKERELGNIRTLKEIRKDWNERYAQYGAVMELV